MEGSSARRVHQRRFYSRALNLSASILALQTCHLWHFCRPVVRSIFDSRCLRKLVGALAHSLLSFPHAPEGPDNSPQPAGGNRPASVGSPSYSLSNPACAEAGLRASHLMIQQMLLFCVSLALIPVSVCKASLRPAFSLWDVGYYLGALGVLLCVRNLLQVRRTPR